MNFKIQTKGDETKAQRGFKVRARKKRKTKKVRQRMNVIKRMNKQKEVQDDRQERGAN